MGWIWFVFRSEKEAMVFKTANKENEKNYTWNINYSLKWNSLG